MRRALLVIISVVTILSACTQRTICPAFQSAYIYDKDQLRKKFSYFQDDSTPKIYTASKTRYLIAEPQSYYKKVRSLQTVAVKPVKTVLPDSLAMEEGEGLLGEESADSLAGDAGVDVGSQLDLAARSVVDSTYIVDVPRKDSAAVAEDSVYQISKDKETRVLKYNMPDSLHYDENSGRYIQEVPKYEIAQVPFNIDQDYYMWMYRDVLVLPDVRLAKMQQKNKGEEEEAEKSGKKKKAKGIKGFFKNLFGKKEKETPQEEAPPPPQKGENDFDFIEDEEAAAATPEETPKQEKEKKGLFGKKKKKKAEPEEQQQPPKEEENVLPPPQEEPEEEKKEDGF